MRHLFLVPACDKAAVENVGKSLKVKVDIPQICQKNGILLSRIITKGDLNASNMVNVWGCKENKYNVWEQMLPGDGVLYYTSFDGKSAFRFYGMISCTIDSPELSAAIWGSSDFRYIHVCKDTPEILLNKDVVFNFLGYKLECVQGFMKVSEKHMERLSVFGNLENVVKFLQKSEV